MANKLKNLKKGDLIYKCSIDEGFGKWHPFWKSDPEDEFEKPSSEMQTYIISKIHQRKWLIKRTVYAIQVNQFTYNKGKFYPNIPLYYRENWQEDDTPDIFSRTKSNAIYKAIPKFKHSDYFNKDIHTKFIGNLKAQYTKLRNKKQ